MAQKINPIGLRLGLTQVWGIITQNYGKKDNLYRLFLINQFLITKILEQYFTSTKDKIIDRWFIFHYQGTVLVLKSLDIQPQLDKDLKANLDLLFPLNLKLNFFNPSETNLTAKFITLYAEHIFNKTGNLKKVSLNIFVFLRKCLNLKKISYCNKTIVQLNLIGFKIKISGRFDNSRNQMAKSYEQSHGSLSLMRLENYVEFYNKTIFTKLGTCSFQIWLFYKINYICNDVGQ
uniref:Ribosomal protein S3 n=1 Tax=Pterocladiella musciformis TaxID=2699131 RepID=A0A1D8X7Q8_9FLOR|nr:ribosomal protein S3 [Pterocladiella musciformis]AOX49076.1 ribosomal protein S3 [Pterocladiella musciformis]